MPLKVGQQFPEGVLFDWAPILDDDPTACGRPQTFNASKEFKGKKVVIVSLPGAFTPQCSAKHLPGYVEKFSELKAKGVDLVAFIMYNDAYVAAAWGKTNKVPVGDEFILLSDTKTRFAQNYGWLAGNGDQTGRFALVVEKDGTISYIKQEENIDDVKLSSVDAILAHIQ